MDSHNVQHYVDENAHTRNEGDIQVNPGSPYAISYRAVVPGVDEAANLYVTAGSSSSGTMKPGPQIASGRLADRRPDGDVNQFFFTDMKYLTSSRTLRLLAACCKWTKPTRHVLTQADSRTVNLEYRTDRQSKEGAVVAT